LHRDGYISLHTKNQGRVINPEQEKHKGTSYAVKSTDRAVIKVNGISEVTSLIKNCGEDSPGE
jgi:hypothetical protein